MADQDEAASLRALEANAAANWPLESRRASHPSWDLESSPASKRSSLCKIERIYETLNYPL